VQTTIAHYCACDTLTIAQQLQRIKKAPRRCPMIWLLAIPLIFSGFWLHAACIAPAEGQTLVSSALGAAGMTMATVGALVVLV
jgi:hypothetical protein